MMKNNFVKNGFIIKSFDEGVFVNNFNYTNYYGIGRFDTYPLYGYQNDEMASGLIREANERWFGY